MKKIVFVFAFVLLVIVVLMAIVNKDAFAQEEAQPDQNEMVRIKPPKEGGTYTYPAPGPGENLTIVVDVPMRTGKVASALAVTKKDKTHAHKEADDLYLRGGLGVSTIYGGLTTNLASAVGIVGGIGYVDSPWRLRGRFNVGKCRADTIAVGGNLATMRRLRGNFWLGVGADLLYCSDLKSHPTESSAKRFVGGSVRMAYERNHFLFEEWIGATKVTFPIPGGRVNHPAVIGGFSASYLF